MAGRQALRRTGPALSKAGPVQIDFPRQSTNSPKRAVLVTTTEHARRTLGVIAQTGLAEKAVLFQCRSPEMNRFCSREHTRRTEIIQR